MIREVSDRRAEIDALARLGMAHLGLGQLQQALQALQQALEISRAMGDREFEFKLQGLITTFSKAQQQSSKSRQRWQFWR